MARSVATTITVDVAELLDFVRPRHRLLLATTRHDGRPQISPVSGGVDPEGRIVISTYPARAKTRNAGERAPVLVGLCAQRCTRSPLNQSRRSSVTSASR